MDFFLFIKENGQITSFYKSEKNCFGFRNESALFNNEVNAEYIINKNTISEEAMIKMYNNVTDFPIWKAIISIQMEHYSNNEVLSIIGNYANVFNPTENDITYKFCIFLIFQILIL